MTRDSIRGSSDRSILILTSLADSPKHGYALISDVEDFAGIKLGAGTLYGALSMLEKAGLVEALPAEEVGLRRIAVAPS
jgi:DNA-binding PadR family transcriptional regulator